MDLTPWEWQAELWSYCRFRAKNHHDAEDLLQDVSLKLLRYQKAHSTLPPKPHRLTAVRNQYVSTKKKDRPWRRKPLGVDVTSNDLSPEITAERRELLQRVSEAVDALPEPYREVTIRCDMRDETSFQAASAMGRPDSTVRTLLSRAHKRLRGRLRNIMDG